MGKPAKTYFNWSSGKDSALAFHLLKNDANFHVDKLVTTVNAHHDRVTMHGLRRELLLAQTDALGLPLDVIELPHQPSMEDYQKVMGDKAEQLKKEGYSDCAFGDIFLEDLRKYREEQLAPFGIKCHFPIWKKDTSELLHEFIELGFRAVIICLKSDLLDASFLGREIDKSFIEDLPPNVDPCGENGEFHTFCFDGPIFRQPIDFSIGEKVFREYKSPEGKKEGMGFWFCDLQQQ